MPSSQKYSLWPAIFIICLAFIAPVTIGTIEMHIARNAHAETAAIQQLQAIAKGENDYHQARGDFSNQLQDLKDLPRAEDFYQYGYRRLSPLGYEVSASPKQPGEHGKRSFYMDQSGVVRYEVLRPAGATSPEVPPIGKK